MDGVQDTTSDAILAWAPAYENYSLKPILPDEILLEIELDVEDSYVDRMNNSWQRALKA
jgi:hypothetical protein